jgi:hypothetical protein
MMNRASAPGPRRDGSRLDSQRPPITRVNFLKRLLGRDRGDVSQASPSAVPPAPEQPALVAPVLSGQTDHDMELLEVLARRPIEHWMVDAWRDRVGPLGEAVNRLLTAAMLIDAPLQDKLNRKFKVPDLKRLLKERSVSTTGNKPQLVDALMKATSRSELGGLVADMRLYSITQLGRRRLDEYASHTREMAAELESTAMHLLLNGQVTQAAAFVKNAQVALGKSAPAPADSVPIASWLLQHEYTDLPLSAGERRKAAAVLALAVLLGESPTWCASRLVRTENGMLTLPDVSAFISSSNCNPYISSLDPDNPQDVAELYAGTHTSQAQCSLELQSLISQRSLTGGKGVSIERPQDDGCESCKHQAKHYSWSLVKNVPALPLHWGCGCSYSLWF